MKLQATLVTIPSQWTVCGWDPLSAAGFLSDRALGLVWLVRTKPEVEENGLIFKTDPCLRVVSYFGPE